MRPPGRDEMRAYYRVLPFANGLPQWEPTDAAWHGGPEPWPPRRRPATDEQLDEWARKDVGGGLFHPVAAFADGVCVGGSAMLSYRVTVPGGGTVGMGGVTSTAVVATHRRRGLLRRMMRAMFDAALERGELLAMLSASEGGIYGRFGFSPATHRTRWELARHQGGLRPAAPDPGSLELVDAAGAQAAWPIVHALVRAGRAGRAGELTPLPGHWERLSDEPNGTDGPPRHLVHRDRHGAVDGAARFRLPWSPTAAHAGTLVVEALEAANPAAYRALWALLLDFDLTRTVVAPGRPRDEPLRWMLADPRAMRVTRQSDNLWARLLDVPAALSRRAYGGADELVFGIDDDLMCPANNRTWLLRTDGVETVCVATDRAAELTLTTPALGSLYFGGASVHDLAYAGRATPHTADALARTARLFRTDTEPHNSFGF